MNIPFDPLVLDELREALGLTDLRASEHVWLALKALSLSGTDIEVVRVEKSASITSAARTLQILQEKYGKKYIFTKLL